MIRRYPLFGLPANGDNIIKQQKATVISFCYRSGCCVELNLLPVLLTSLTSRGERTGKSAERPWGERQGQHRFKQLIFGFFKDCGSNFSYTPAPFH